ncbi:MAG: sulfatase-like hydrolase/transferase [Bacteroidales bacterium]|jgi:phosphoglycerol transferase MdoB-like AlkP superfamily enzyme|nr:sulfatase-like hydrolase/transferase [Bacteroidales bacterium]
MYRKKRILFFLYYFLYWMVFFLTARLVFMLYRHDLSFALNIREWGNIFLYGAWMDASVSGYISAVVALLLACTTFSGGVVASRTVSAYTYIVAAIAGLMTVADAELYGHWGFRLDSTPLMYLKTPKEAFASIGTGKIILLLALFALFTCAAGWIYRTAVHATLKKSGRTGWAGIPVFLFAAALMILPIRGNLGVAPMNVGFVYHSEKIFANHAAINVVWNVGKSLSESEKISEYAYMDKQQAEALFEKTHPSQRETGKLLHTERPNVIVMIFESFSNRMIAALGGKTGVTPNLNRLCREGIAFSGIYSVGDRTDKGLLGVLSGYPAHPTARVIKYPEKTRRLPFLSKDFKQAGYHTEHVSGFDNKFSNIMSYLSNAGYDRITDRNDFPAETYRDAKWGVPDHYVFEKLLERCNDTGQPFFKSFITLSSHEPFDVPMLTVIEGSDDESRFLNAAYYTDRALGAFIDSARHSAWWDNTLIVITADHGTGLPGYLPAHDPERFHIPMIWTGGAVAVKDTVITTVATQTDIARTVLAQLGIRGDAYRFGKDILGTPVSRCAFYTFNDGFGWVTDSARIEFDNVSRSVIYRDGNLSPEMIEQGKATLQVFAEHFKNLGR